MSEIASQAVRQLMPAAVNTADRISWRLLVVLLLAALAVPADLRALVVAAMSDAYLQVTVFVGATLGLVYWAEAWLGGDLGRLMSRSRAWQMPVASFLGALPGCGGAIIVVTQYTRGFVSFGGVIAVLVATMGDAAFLLLAREPTTGLAIMGASVVLGIASGWLVDLTHGQDFMRLRPGQTTESPSSGDAPLPPVSAGTGVRTLARLNGLWVALLVPGVILGLCQAFLVDTDVFFGPLAEYQPTQWLGVAGAGLCVALWVLAPSRIGHAAPPEASASAPVPIWSRIIADTSFVTVWVICGFLSYEVVTHMVGAGVEQFLAVWAPLVPLMAILIGFVPGCGPQIVVTTLYLAGAVPLSAQIGNAISNDGDALFPAIALAPRAVVVATFYTAIPALVVAYGYYLLFE